MGPEGYTFWGDLFKENNAKFWTLLDGLGKTFADEKLRSLSFIYFFSKPIFQQGQKHRSFILQSEIYL